MATRKRKSKNYVNNADLLIQIQLSKDTQEQNPNFTPAECLSNELVKMLMMLVDKYSQKGNWRNYCVDKETECLTQRGWLSIEELSINDIILSFSGGKLQWSKIDHIHTSHYTGNMFHLRVQGMDALVTPGHRFMTTEGLKKVELLREKDKIILLGKHVDYPEKTHDDAFVELVGCAVTVGNYHEPNDRKYTRVTLSQKEGTYADRIRRHLCSLNEKFGEGNKEVIIFSLSKELGNKIMTVAPNRILSMPFILSLTQLQRELLINTMICADGCITYEKYMNYCQVNKEHIDSFIALCTMAGKRTSVRIRPPTGYEKKPCYTVHIFSNDTHHSMVENIDFHGGKGKGIRRKIGESKSLYPNNPTVKYDGEVWCPKTEFGCFVAKRNGYVYLTGNTYIDDMRGDAIMSLCQNALKFKSEKSINPYGYYTQIVTHSFLTFLEKEKKVRNIRDDILERNGLTPSFTRQIGNGEEFESDEAKNARELYTKALLRSKDNRKRKSQNTVKPKNTNEPKIGEKS